MLPKATNNSRLFITDTHKEHLKTIISNQKSCILGHMLLEAMENIVKTSSSYPQNHLPQFQNAYIYLIHCALKLAHTKNGTK